MAFYVNMCRFNNKYAKMRSRFAYCCDWEMWKPERSWVSNVQAFARQAGGG